MEEFDACVQIAAMEFVVVCGGCDPVPLRVESMETAEGRISALGTAKTQTDTNSVVLAVVVTATVSLLLGGAGGLGLGMVRGRTSTGGRARISTDGIKGMEGKSGKEHLPEQLLGTSRQESSGAI